jgi:hypothetical protein
LVNVVVSDDVLVVLFLPDKFPIHDFVSLVAHETVQRLNDRVEVQTLGHRFHSVLALGTTVVVVCALENEAEALWDEAYIAGLPPAKEVECDLAETIVLAHVVHGITPAIESAVEGLCAFVLGALDTFQALKPGVLGMADGVVKIELGSKVPFPVVGMQTADVIRMHGEQCLIRSHAGGSRVEQLHRKVKLHELGQTE